jgi:hypothetical protein
MAETYSGSKTYTYARLTASRGRPSSSMTFTEALEESWRTGCAIHPVGHAHSWLYVKPQGPRNKPILFIGQPRSRKHEPGTYLEADYYLMRWAIAEGTSLVKKALTLECVFPELRALRALEPNWKLSDLCPAEVTPEKKWRLSDLF